MRSISRTTSMDCFLLGPSLSLGVSTTLPKTTCLPSSQLVLAVVMKNWEPLLIENMWVSGCKLFKEGGIQGNI